MGELLPRWMMRKYLLLRRKFNSTPFTYEQAKKVLKGDEEGMISVTLSELRKKGWLTIQLNPHDARKRLYQLMDMQQVMKGIEKELIA